jgi:hypothetical protein
MSTYTEQAMPALEQVVIPVAKVPLFRPFEVLAIGCGITTLIGIFVVSSVFLTGMIIAMSLLTLVGAMLYYGAVSAKHRVQRSRAPIAIAPARAMSDMSGGSVDPEATSAF